MNRQRFKFLLDKYINNALTDSERHEFFALRDAADDSELAALIDEMFSGQTVVSGHADAIGRKIFRKILLTRNRQNKEAPQGTLRRWAKPVTVAAAAIAIGGFLLVALLYSSQHSVTPGTMSTPSAAVAGTAPPAIAKPVITLGNGQRIVLDSAGYGQLAMQGSASISKLSEGQIRYANDGVAGEDLPLVYNSVVVPKGSLVVSLILEDGTQVWMNAGSSMRYPAVFGRGMRKIEVSGEVYFDVAKDKSRGFVVQAGTVLTEVLGTRFNIRAHGDEEDPRITLIEGAVKVTSGADARLLKPGEQAVATPASRLSVNNVDPSQVLAWKEGRFQFNGDDIQTVMREIARWYDLDITYEGDTVQEHFRGGISRNVDASSVFKMLAATDAVHFKISGKKVVVTP